MTLRRTRLCIVTENVAPPFDEGFKRVIEELCKHLAALADTLVLGRNLSPAVGESLTVDKYFLGPAVRRVIAHFGPDVVLYIPMASLTVGSLLRGKLLEVAAAPVVILGLQARGYSRAQRWLVRSLGPKLTIVQSQRTRTALERLGLRAESIHSGVDLDRFAPVAAPAQATLRDRYGLPRGRRVILHVGHVKPGRGLGDLVNMAGDSLPLILSSSSTRLDEALRARLERRGARIVHGYVERVEELYQLADAYVFPTRDQASAIEFPLSVLEAAACGLPVLSTRYGGLVESLPETQRFAYYDTVDEGRQKLTRLLAMPAGRERPPELARFGWDRVAAELLAKIERVSTCA